MKTPLLDEDCKALTTEPPPSRSQVESLLSDDPLGLLLTQGVICEASIANLEVSPEDSSPREQPTLELESGGVPDAPILELKPLSDSLRYEFLGPNETFPIIISSSLTSAEVSKLLEVV